MQILDKETKAGTVSSNPSVSNLKNNLYYNSHHWQLQNSIALGNYETAFIDSFNTMFHKNKNLATVQRFHYLKSCLEGQAANVIQSIPTRGENYLHAYNTLINRYENKNVIIQAHIRKLFDTLRITITSVSELHGLHNRLTSNVNVKKPLYSIVR